MLANNESMYKLYCCIGFDYLKLSIKEYSKDMSCNTLLLKMINLTVRLSVRITDHMRSRFMLRHLRSCQRITCI